MNMGTKFKDTFGKVMIHLTRLDDLPLGKAALVIFIL
jgi:hypothetical protein